MHLAERIHPAAQDLGTHGDEVQQKEEQGEARRHDEERRE